MEEEQSRNQSTETKNDGRAAEAAEIEEEEEENVLQFLDSMDSYLTLIDSLSSTLREGWMELASARYSMGVSRVTSTLFDLKLHPAATTVQVNLLEDSMEKQPQFTLSKWSCCSDGKCCSREIDADGKDLHNKANDSQLRRRGTSHFSDEAGEEQTTSIGSPRSPLAVDDPQTSTGSPRSPFSVDDPVQKERYKSLSVFGTLVSPKLRAAQTSFETALETLVKVANMRSLMLSAHAQIQQGTDGRIG